MQIKKHRITGKTVTFQPTPNIGGKFERALPDTIVIHYTAGSNAKSSARTLSNPNVRASAHVIIARDGSVIQLADFDTITWHAGKSTYAGRSGFNNYSIGIELDNAGALEKREDGGYYSWFNRKYPQEEVVKATHRNETNPRYWHVFSEAQIDAVFELCRLLKEAYKIKFILGHEEISPGRKIDPGPAFPLDKLRDQVLYGRDSEKIEGVPEKGKVIASALNIRSGPAAINDTVALPLINGTEVEILEEKNGWYRIKTSIEGWVAADYIK